MQAKVCRGCFKTANKEVLIGWWGRCPSRAQKTIAAVGNLEQSQVSDSSLHSLPSQGREIPDLHQERPEHIKSLGWRRRQQVHTASSIPKLV